MTARVATYFHSHANTYCVIITRTLFVIEHNDKIKTNNGSEKYKNAIMIKEEVTLSEEVEEKKNKIKVEHGEVEL